MGKTLAVASLAVLLFTTGCAAEKDDPAAPARVIAISFDREVAGSGILVTAHLTEDGAPLPGARVTVSTAGGAASTVTDAGGGDYLATVTPDALDTEVAITAASGDASTTRIALPITVIDDAWGQPEALPGLVNSPGWEDGANVSPDGQWLLVASISPIDILTCFIGGLQTAEPACMAIIGPYQAPERPDFLGADRIHDGTYDSACPDIGITDNMGYAFPPVSGYGFRRQADGSFAEPFVIGFDANGCLGPFGMSFTSAPSGTAAGMVFTFNDPLDNPDQTDEIFYAPLTLGQKNDLGDYSVGGSGIQVAGFTPTLLQPSLPAHQGNPAYVSGFLLWDDESLPGADRDLYASAVTGTLPALTAGTAFTVGASFPGQPEIQPFVDGTTLYYMGGSGITQTTLMPASDPALAGSWSAPNVVLGAAGGTILAIGEPTVADVGGTKELYFVYVTSTPGGGKNANVGRVRMR